jgi:EAL domain-containing protein (putative c-di-GMP-specific phosphodiesterase class I)
VGVNISSRQLSQPDFPRLVKQILDETGLDGEYLRLELTERVAMDSPELTAPVLSELQDLGVRLSIDDFGTGYSSLKYLHRFSVDTLKIDQYFIDKMQHDQRNLEIVRTIVSLAHNLQMKVVAEGAETAEQVALLSAMNCDYAQGHVFAKPMEPSELASFLDSTPGFRVPLKKNSAS